MKKTQAILLIVGVIAIIVVGILYLFTNKAGADALNVSTGKFRTGIAFGARNNFERPIGNLTYKVRVYVEGKYTLGDGGDFAWYYYPVKFSKVTSTKSGNFGITETEIINAAKTQFPATVTIPPLQKIHFANEVRLTRALVSWDAVYNNQIVERGNGLSGNWGNGTAIDEDATKSTTFGEIHWINSINTTTNANFNYDFKYSTGESILKINHFWFY